MKIAVLGCGKRFVNIYWFILKSLGHEVFLWNRTIEKSINFCKQEKYCSYIENLESLKDIEADVVLCFVPSHYQFELLKKIPKLNCPILLETPSEDEKLLTLSGIDLGVLEQWPQLPLEQFKRLIYKKGLISRPYMVFNDGRSFDYHAIAQLRTYLNFAIPNIAKGTVKIYKNPGFLENSGKLNTNHNEWTIGQIEMSDGSVLLHNFAYNCKSSLSIPIQFIRSYSLDGSIVTGRMKELGNDYEFIDIRYIDKISKEVKLCEVTIDRIDNKTHSILIKKEDISWTNPYGHLNFDDQQTAIASLIDGVSHGNLYSYKDAYIDNICMKAIKQSAYSQQVIKISS